jgi:hypothetical protein
VRCTTLKHVTAQSGSVRVLTKRRPVSTDYYACVRGQATAHRIATTDVETTVRQILFGGSVIGVVLRHNSRGDTSDQITTFNARTGKRLRTVEDSAAVVQDVFVGRGGEIVSEWQDALGRQDIEIADSAGRRRVEASSDVVEHSLAYNSTSHRAYWEAAGAVRAVTITP